MATRVFGDVHDVTVDRRTTPYGERRFRAFLADADPVTLVDTGLPDTTDALFGALDELGVAPERVVITHGDPDHVGGFDAVVDRFSPETWVPRETDVETEATPDYRFEDGDSVGPFTAVHVPGHEPDNYVLVNEDAGYAIMGDALSGADQRGLPDGYLLLPPGDKSRDLKEAERNLRKLLDFDFEAALVFHGSSVTEGASEKLAKFVNYPGAH